MTSTVQGVMGHVRQELEKTIVGQSEALDLLLLTVLCGGHALIEGVPGVAKTLAVRTLGTHASACSSNACSARPT